LAVTHRTVRHGAVIDANDVSVSADVVAIVRGDAFNEAVACIGEITRRGVVGRHVLRTHRDEGATRNLA
jgi:hypothetical protein